MPNIEISIILASRNGSDTLPSVLKALSAVLDKHEDIELILADNGSTDDTAKLMQRFSGRTDVILLSEPREGKSYALNHAIDAAKGKLLVFIDDDIIPDSGWLDAYRDAAAVNPDTGAFLGQIRPKFLAPAEDWLVHLTDIGKSSGCTAKTLPAGSTNPNNTKGGNWAVRQEALGEMRFDEVFTNLKSGRRPTGGQDTEMAGRILRSGYGVDFVPEARVEHMVQAHEMTKRFIFERYRRLGRNSAAIGSRSFARNLFLPIEVPVLGAISCFSWLIGLRRTATINLTRFGACVGRIEYFAGRLGERFNGREP